MPVLIEDITQRKSYRSTSREGDTQGCELLRSLLDFSHPGSNRVQAEGVALALLDDFQRVWWRLMPLSHSQFAAGNQCASVSTDGQMMWWDTRRLGEPTDTLQLATDSKGGGMVLGGSSMEYNQEAGPTKYLVGTEQGIVLQVHSPARPHPPPPGNLRKYFVRDFTYATRVSRLGCSPVPRSKQL